MRFAGKPLFVALAAVSSAACASTDDARPQPLDGRTYAVSLVGDGQAPASDDLVFADGSFESALSSYSGFKKSPYSTRLVAGGVAFDVSSDSPEHGRNEWHGVAAGRAIEGTVVRTPKNGDAPITATFAGERVR
jgi:hypothetical protein